MEKEKTILNGNKLIAEFMGLEYERTKDVFSNRPLEYYYSMGNPGNWRVDKTTKCQYAPQHLMYHTEWDWLMPVVDKIEKTKIGKDRFPVVTIEPGICIVSDNGEAPIREEQGDSKIENVWFAVIGFIEWYNTK